MSSIKCLDLSLPTPEENLACDEALLDWCESRGRDAILRFWEPSCYFVVVGYANRIDTEVRAEACATEGIPIFRRCSGGGAVVQGPGCLNYSLVLKFGGPAEEELGADGRAECGDGDGSALRTVPDANRHIMERHRKVLAELMPGATMEARGHTDLAINGLKFSGNAQRRKKHFLLFHGAFLLNFDIALIEKVLPMPSQQPDYRRNRRHRDFLANLNISADSLKNALRRAWGASETLVHFPREQIKQLACDKYATKDWNFKF